MDSIGKVDRLAKQIQDGEFEPDTPLLDGRFMGPSRVAMNERVEALFADADPDAIPPRLRQQVDEVLRLLYEGGPAPSPRDLSMGAEAVVVADGSRPVFFFEQDGLRPGRGTGPFVDVLNQKGGALEAAALAVGRVETDARSPPPGADKWFEGTAFMVGPNLAMTNRHVIERMVNEPNSEGPFFTLNTTYWLNFGGQQGTAARRFLIEDIVFAGSDPIGAGGDLGLLDMALLRIGAPEVAGLASPAILPISARPLSTFEKVAVIGFPAAPPIYAGSGAPPVGYEIEQVLRDVFDSRFGYKRCASGEIDAMAGTYTADVKKWAVKHDASTLAGNSGSPVLLLGGGQLAVSALHFAGKPREANYAHAFSALAAVLRENGVQIQP